MGRDAQLAYCRKHMLPIWERWTDGNLDARRVLDCADDAAVRQFMRTIVMLRALNNDAATSAALAAGMPIFTAYVGISMAKFQSMCEEAQRADLAGMQAQAYRQS